VTTRAPATAVPADLDSIPDQPAVFLLWAGEGKPYLARTALLRRRLKRLISDHGRVSRLLNLRGVAERIEYWPTGSQIEAALIHLDLAREYFPEDWRRITRLRRPAFLRLTLDNPYPRTMITTRVGRGLFYGPFANRAAAEHFQNGVLDLFQIRRCEENLAPSSEHPGCIYGEMNRCLRPCQQAVSMEEYRSEAARVEQFLGSHGATLIGITESARDRASAEMQFEEAERLHQRLARVREVQNSGGGLARSLAELNGVAITRSAEMGAVDLRFLTGGSWQETRRLEVSEGAGESMDHRLREMAATLDAPAAPDPEHLAILIRWHGSSWRDGEWIGFESLERIPYRKLVNAISRVHQRR
jgi:excinuclease UvrABC nuclease subunit